MITLDNTTASAIYDLLVKEAGAHEGSRYQFVGLATTGCLTEFRFGGSLGFGGKFYATRNRWYVACYREDGTIGEQR